MITLTNVNKYFNRHKKNEIHVIKNTSLTFDNKGLVALLGPSGCGKTTILNAIGGLDKIASGRIYINNKKISSKNAYKVDKIRNLNIGYIFQDYKLVENLSVFDNVALALKMVGIKDKKEIKTRVEYVLDKVGILRYKQRPAGMLSGGERQRVGIARAIVKNPDIILADEPTGNLDSKNSLEIMNIIKSISKNKLVILVTHEQALAKFYATRIIELKDGHIKKDYINNHEDDLDYTIDNRFYLKDFTDCDILKDENTDIKVYSDIKDKVKLEIVVKNGNIYIKSKNKNKIQIVDENSSIEFINDHYKKIHKDDVEKYDFDLESISNKTYKKKYSSILNPISLIIKGFKRVFDYPFLKKILLIGFFISAIFIMYAVSSISATFNIEDKDFIEYNPNYLIVNTKKINVNDFLTYEEIDNINYIIPTDSKVNFSLKINDYYQTSNNIINITSSLSDIEMINKDDLILGNMPTNSQEIVIDKLIIDRLFKENEMLKMVGIIKIEDFINRELEIQNMDKFKIVGISDNMSPSIYTYKENFVNILYNQTENDLEDTTEENNIIDYNLYKDKIALKQGKIPANDYEIIVNIINKDTMPLNKKIDIKVNNTKLTVVGYYESKDNYSYYLTNNNTIKYKLIESSENLSIYSNDKTKTIDDFRKQDLNISDSYEKSKLDYEKSIEKSVKNTLLVSGIILLISLIEIFFMIRASYLSRVKEIGIYRAIGVKKIDIYKMFFGEIFAITTLASLPGLILMAYILNILSNIKYIEGMFLINPIIITVSIIFVYLFNLIIGLFPVYNIVRKRPAQILARYDLD